MSNLDQTAVIGAGVIGASWTALFLAAGKSVTVCDPADGTESMVRGYVDEAWPTLQQLGLVKDGTPGDLRFTDDPALAVAGAGFVQESVPERLPIKHALHASIETALSPGAVVASSASGLTLTEMQGGWIDPGPLVLGHPFNPPHLIPLVEIMGNAHTRQGAIDTAERFYAEVGKVTIRVNKEVPGHVANRLQAALWREAIHLVNEGVASVEDVDKAVWAGPGLRWAAMGPTMLFHLGAGDGGLAEFCTRYSDSFNRWWDDLGTPHLDADTADRLVAGITAAAPETSPEALSSQRDALIAAMQAAAAPLRQNKD